MQKKTPTQFKVIVEQDEDGFFVARVPALPGCVTQAKTAAELTRRVRDAIKLCQEVARTDSQYRNRIRQFAYQPVAVGMELVSL
ncbi:MAG: hypothetical protein UY78_C0027G0004 [Parcubacteria group bacterium GW2011_GWA1_53_13]|nr:MAG: hypothetical protein UY71_C0045G0006 [Parcubacteria group bacterium GW2011_GWB1_52_7]KKW32828.1 MAG: hypothetical protein UY78_C0027G0004 [Parcubacteria group bacterium GW2011_GWA1_53_13]